MSSADGASTYIAPRDIPFSQRVRLFFVPKPQATPQNPIATPNADECPTDPKVQVEWHENTFKQLYKQRLVIQDEILPFSKQLIPDAFTIPTLPLAAGFETWLHTLVAKVHAAAQGLDAARE